MKTRKRYALPFLASFVFASLTGCATDTPKTPERTYLDDTQVTLVKANYPEGYAFSESYYGTERGGAALRHPGYEHTLVSPYAVHDQTGKRYVARDLDTQVLLTSVSSTAYANGPRGTFTQAPRFCDENSFMLPNSKQMAKRGEYLQIKERYCSTPGYRLSQHEIDVLTRGEPEELRQYRLKMYVDNQFTKF